MVTVLHFNSYHTGYNFDLTLLELERSEEWLLRTQENYSIVEETFKSKALAIEAYWNTLNCKVF